MFLRRTDRAPGNVDRWSSSRRRLTKRTGVLEEQRECSRAANRAELGVLVLLTVLS
jgi:hypothetical protein